MVVIVAACGWAFEAYISYGPTELWVLCITIFTIAWILQFVGHAYEGKKPSFFEDIQFLLIGPLWILSFIYQKLRIPYRQTD
ncbi:Mpo1-like protein [Oceanicoccus sp. KOV_DT_Chl]|uniref:Mpo1-like protein n=1 Tax=Oceanicoccus sp. KOV_DT_Chl TaxID=1904639 RepID=UPI00190E75C7